MMSLELRIASVVLRDVIPYKYTVFSPRTKTTDKDQVYEFIEIQDRSIGIVNRVLQLQDLDQQG